MQFLAIGDIVTDAFIFLSEARITTDTNGENPEITMRWGDKIPYENAVVLPAVGNSPNAAVAACRLGLSTSLRAYVGDDGHGKECYEVLKNEGIGTDYMVTEPGKKTNYHYALSYQSERTILVKHEEFSYSVPEFSEIPEWIYLSSLGTNSLPYHKELSVFLAKHPSIKLAFQPGTFQMELGVEALRDIYTRTNIFFCNKEEAERILGHNESKDIIELLEEMRALGPEIVVITDGRKGAYAYDGNEKLSIPMYPDVKTPVERTGAGDAFASTITSALALGKSLKEALLWGPVNSMSVVHEIGAQQGLLSKEVLEQFLTDAPASYTVTTL